MDAPKGWRITPEFIMSAVGSDLLERIVMCNDCPRGSTSIMQEVANVVKHAYRLGLQKAGMANAGDSRHDPLKDAKPAGQGVTGTFTHNA